MNRNALPSNNESQQQATNIKKRKRRKAHKQSLPQESGSKSLAASVVSGAPGKPTDGVVVGVDNDEGSDTLSAMDIDMQQPPHQLMTSEAAPPAKNEMNSVGVVEERRVVSFQTPEKEDRVHGNSSSFNICDMCRKRNVPVDNIDLEQAEFDHVSYYDDSDMDGYEEGSGFASRVLDMSRIVNEEAVRKRVKLCEEVVAEQGRQSKKLLEKHKNGDDDLQDVARMLVGLNEDQYLQLQEGMLTIIDALEDLGLEITPFAKMNPLNLHRAHASETPDDLSPSPKKTKSWKKKTNKDLNVPLKKPLNAMNLFVIDECERMKREGVKVDLRAIAKSYKLLESGRIEYYRQKAAQLRDEFLKAKAQEAGQSGVIVTDLDNEESRDNSDATVGLESKEDKVTVGDQDGVVVAELDNEEAGENSHGVPVSLVSKEEEKEDVDENVTQDEVLVKFESPRMYKRFLMFEYDDESDQVIVSAETNCNSSIIDAPTPYNFSNYLDVSSPDGPIGRTTSVTGLPIAGVTYNPLRNDSLKSVIVGNEVLLRGEQTIEQMVSNIAYTRSNLTSIGLTNVSSQQPTSQLSIPTKLSLPPRNLRPNLQRLRRKGPILHLILLQLHPSIYGYVRLPLLDVVNQQLSTPVTILTRSSVLMEV
ncbi:hypothetical protein HDU76_005445 [Blyttiomyces sp. JEL0837]|nr:hypothetical protein HDU76_005445 [Blyttiomyces sp. JEL0837]